MQLNSPVTVCLIIIVVLGFISVTDSQKSADKKRFRGNANYQYFLELEQKRRLRSNNELEQQQQQQQHQRRAQKRTSQPVTTSTTTTTMRPTTRLSSSSTSTTTTVAPIINRRLMTNKIVTNDTIVAASSSVGRGANKYIASSIGSTKEVIRRKKKASIHLDSDNEIRRDEGEEEQQQPDNQRFLSPSVRRYLALGRAIPGRPGTDYPILAQVPYTNFYCDEQEYPGFFADMETRCQGWHYCDIDGRQATFLCPNGTQFSQAFFVCDWWFNVACDNSQKLYFLNSRLYQRPKTSTPPVPHRVITKVLIDEMFN